MKKLIIQLSGGIGNQLFQYHAGYAVAKACGAVLFIDDSRVSKGKYVRSNRDSGLSSSNLRGISGVNEVFLRNGFIHDFSRMNKWKSFVPFLRDTLVDTSPNGEIGVKLSIGDIRRLIPEQRTIRFRGNLQSLQIVEFARDKGCMPLFQPKDVSDSFFQSVDQLTSQSLLGIHLRAKDYGIDSNMTKLSDLYYRKAIEMALEEEKGSAVWIFTDSEVDARRKYGWIFDLPNLKVVKAHEFNDLETLYVMSKIDQLIISNSTFSFWGGMFNSTGKIYAPEPWFNSPGKIIGDSLSSEVNLIHFQFPQNWEIIKWI